MRNPFNSKQLQFYEYFSNPNRAICHLCFHVRIPFLFFFPKQDGKLPFVPGEEEFIMGVSKYGIKVTSLDQCVSNEWFSNMQLALL